MEQVFKRKNKRINKDLLWVNQPKNNRYIWQKPDQGESFQHMSHVSIESEYIIICQQETPGDCILHDKKFYSCYFTHMEDHYHRRHYSKALKIYYHLILHCKCKDIQVIGQLQKEQSLALFRMLHTCKQQEAVCPTFEAETQLP